MNVMPAPLGTRAKPPAHRNSTVAYRLDGECAVYFGDHHFARHFGACGEQTLMPADVPHAPAMKARSQEGIVLLLSLRSVG
jgi:uncharacterized RmlC-like cupin family protein